FAGAIDYRAKPSRPKPWTRRSVAVPVMASSGRNFSPVCFLADDPEDSPGQRRGHGAQSKQDGRQQRLFGRDAETMQSYHHATFPHPPTSDRDWQHGNEYNRRGDDKPLIKRHG